MKFRSVKEKADAIKRMESQLREEIEDFAQQFKSARKLILEMEFDRIITRQADADRMNGAEQAVKAGRRIWSIKKVFREVKYRLNQTPMRAEFDFRDLDRQEQRYVDDHEREFREDAVGIIERQMTIYRDEIRRNKELAQLRQNQQRMSYQVQQLNQQARRARNGGQVAGGRGRGRQVQDQRQPVAERRREDMRNILEPEALEERNRPRPQRVRPDIVRHEEENREDETQGERRHRDQVQEHFQRLMDRVRNGPEV